MMHVALVHSYYRAGPSGENAAVDASINALRRAGHDVSLFFRRSEELNASRTYPIRAAAGLVLNRQYEPWAEILKLSPDVVHVHNTFPNIGTRQLSALSSSIPVVVTLHNYRTWCSAGTFNRPGALNCQDCLTNRWSAVAHSCYQGSSVKTLPVAASRKFDRDPLLLRADRICVLTEAMAELMVQLGLSESKLVVLPNFVQEGPLSTTCTPEAPFVYAGRLTHEKGIVQLLEVWPKEVPLDVYGAGPCEEEVRRLSRGRVQFKGVRSAAEVREILALARGLVFASIWREGLPIVYLEAVCAGTPVLALDTNTLAQMVSRDGTGLVASWAHLAEDVLAAQHKFPLMRRGARQAFVQRYSEVTHVRRLESIYAQARGAL